MNYALVYAAIIAISSPYGINDSKESLVIQVSTTYELCHYAPIDGHATCYKKFTYDDAARAKRECWAEADARNANEIPNSGKWGCR